MTRLFLASWTARPYLLAEAKPPYVLDSFHYFKKVSGKSERTIMNYVLSNDCKMFLLDSGAFTYMAEIKNSGSVKINFDRYVEEYAAFINKYDIQYFFELDIDSVVGLEKVEQLRAKLESLTGKKCIPVFHKSRGKEYWFKMIQEYDYVALGGIAIKDFKKSEHKLFKWFIDTAHKANTKIHGLGYTNDSITKRNNFDSVDSTSWLGGSRFGNLDMYDPVKKKLIKYPRPANTKTVKGFYKHADYLQCIEWVKWGQHLEKANKRKVLW
ncbi:TPA: hypothetical protein I1496_001768 [Staphylococcus pseudintermedius]|nr:hypothetical protein [Staphylococcus pseudintermedius]HAR5731480.1 hypothetical protein [Staphylococcus pseudintermedius]